jgi:hypothetical protein
MNFKQFANKYRVRIVNEYTDSNPHMPDSCNMNHFKTTLRMEHRQMTIIFSQGYGITGEPTADSVLNCLVSDAWGIDNARDFEDWAGEYGYDTDSRRAERTYNACVQQTAKLKQFAGDHYDELLSCEE